MISVNVDVNWIVKQVLSDEFNFRGWTQHDTDTVVNESILAVEKHMKEMVRKNIVEHSMLEAVFGRDVC